MRFFSVVVVLGLIATALAAPLPIEESETYALQMTQANDSLVAREALPEPVAESIEERAPCTYRVSSGTCM
jgi:hypothetical protein